jgi:NADPH:quinone reductase-like Zn-dependent oxidoreductase
MKAITRTKYGGPEVLTIQDLPKPTPKSQQVLVRVYATTVNRTDCGILWAKPFIMRFFTGLFNPKHLSPGTDFAGEVVELGSGIKSFKVGDRVFGFNDQGLASHAEFMVIDENDAIAKIPDHVSYHDAVASGEGAHYAFNMINKVDLSKHKKALVYGATGAIGSAAVQLLKHYGLYVTAVGNTPNMDMIKSIGADKTYDYLTEDFTQDHEKYPLILDAVGKISFEVCKKLLTPKGTYISSELGAQMQNTYLPLITSIKGGKQVIFPIPTNCRRSILFMNELLENNEFKPVIDKTYHFSEIKEAYQYVVSGNKTGNVIVSFN